MNRKRWVRRVGAHNIYELISKGKVGFIPRNSWNGKGVYYPLFCLTCKEPLLLNYLLHFCYYSTITA